MAVKVFIHICAINHVADVLREIVTCIHMSGLYADAERIYCYVAGEPDLIEWVYMLEYFLIGRYRECLAHLRGQGEAAVDTVGVNYRGGPEAHWNGNWWWVRGDYFLTLPRKIGGEYFDPELNFLFARGARHYEIYRSQCPDHYDFGWCPEKYVT